MLIALVAVYPIIYAVWLSLHEYSLIAGGPVPLGGARSLGNYTNALWGDASDCWDGDRGHVHLHRSSPSSSS